MNPRLRGPIAISRNCCRNCTITGLGVQVLFGFLLSLPFTNRFTRLSQGQRELYLATLVLAAVATALLLGPVAFHRLVFRRGQKDACPGG